MSIRSFETHTPQIASSAYIDEAALVVGEVEIGDLSSVWPMSVVRGDVHSIKIGDKTNIQDGSILHVTHDSQYQPGGYPLIIGNQVTVGHQVTLHACTIEDLCLIGMGSVVLDGAIVQKHVIIGAGSLVPPGKTLTSGLWLGSPVQKVRDLTPNEIQYLSYSAEHYVRLKKRHEASLSTSP